MSRRILCLLSALFLLGCSTKDVKLLNYSVVASEPLDAEMTEGTFVVGEDCSKGFLYMGHRAPLYSKAYEDAMSKAGTDFDGLKDGTFRSESSFAMVTKLCVYVEGTAVKIPESAATPP